MDMLEFRCCLLSEIDNYSKANKQYEQQAFLQKITGDLEALEVCREADWCYYQKPGRRNRIDEVHGYSTDEDGTMSLYFCSFSGNDELGKMTYSDFTSCVKKIIAFVEDAASGYVEEHSDLSEPGYELAREIRTGLKDINRFNIWVITDSIRSDRFHEIDDMEPIFEKQTSARLVDIKRYYEELMHGKSDEDVVIDVNEFGYDGLVYLDAGESNSEMCTSYICAVPGRFLAEVYCKYGSRVLESNVRSFLTVRGKINRGIRDTIRTRPGMFFAYNNGISATSKEIKFDDDGKIISLTDFQIVNGGQTTVSLFNELKTTYCNNLNDIHVLMKLSVIDSEDTSELVSNISRYANTQNAVKDSDLDSNNEFQKRMESMSRSTRIPEEKSLGTKKWYYERSRGQWDQDRARLKEGERRAFEREYAKERVIDKIFFAKCRFMLEMRPHTVCRGGQTCYSFFSKEIIGLWQKDQSMFNDRYYKETIASAILYKAIYKEISKQTWFTGGFRAQMASYSFSKLIFTINSCGRKLNMTKIWETQTIPEEIVEQSMVICEFIFKYLVSVGNQGINITQWCKKDGCWEYIKGMQIPINESTMKHTIAEAEHMVISKIDSANQKEIDAANVLNEVKMYDVTSWYRLQIQASKCGATLDDVNILKEIVNYVKSGGSVHLNPDTASQAMRIRRELTRGE